MNIIAGTIPFRLLQIVQRNSFLHDFFYNYTIFYSSFLFSVYIAGFIQALIISILLTGKQIFITYTKIEFSLILIILLSFFIMGYYLELA
jgi:hypothetical protein